MNTNSSEYKKTATKILRRKFWKLYPVPMDSELFQRIVNDYLSGDGSGQHPWFSTSSTTHWEADTNEFVYSWYCACGTDCNERGYMWIEDRYDKNGKLIVEDEFPSTPTIQALTARLKEFEESKA